MTRADGGSKRKPRVSAVASLRESEAKYRALIEHAGDGLELLNGDGRYIDVNAATCRMHGYTREEMLRLSLPDVDPTKDLAAFRADFAVLDPQGVPTTFESTHRRKDGTEFAVEVQAAAIDLGGRRHALALVRDITERKRTEAALRRNEAQFRILSESALVGIYLVQDGRFVYANPTLEQIGGYGPGELFGQEIMSFIHPADRALVADQIRRRITGEAGPTRYEIRVLRKDGEERWVEIRGSAVVYDDHMTLIGTIQDITESHRTEASLRESEERYRVLFEAESDALVLIDNQTGRILEANGAAAMLYGYPREELLKLKNTDLSAQPEETRQVTKETPLVPQEIVKIPLRYHRKRDGTIFPVEITGRFFLQQNRPVHIAAIRDISERTLALARLNDSERKFRQLYEQLRDGHVRVGIDGTILEFNEAYRALTGYTREELLRLTYIDLTPERWHEMERRIVAEEILPLGYSRLYEKEYRRKDGSIVPIELLTRLESDDAGRPVAMSAIVRDITTRKLKEAELVRSNADLQQFASVASHDLQEPLRMVASYVGLLAARYQDQLDGGGREFIQYALAGTERMRQLIESLLQFSRLATKTLPFASVPLDEILDRTRENLALAIADAGASVSATALPTVLGDENQLLLLFQNLVGNAIKFSRPGEPPRIEINARPSDGTGMRTLSVRDQGIGIAPKHFERIFVIFQRLHAEGEYPGTGIGLALCKRIVERHGGRIWVESEPGRGATFFFTLPEATPPAADAAGSAPA